MAAYQESDCEEYREKQRPKYIVFRDKSYAEEYDYKLHCPVCGCCNVHFGQPTHLDFPIGEDCNIIIPMNCESGHAWDFMINFHQGESTIWVDNCRKSARN